MSELESLINRARKLGHDYPDIYHGCAPTTFLAVADTLGMPVSNEMFRMTAGLSSVTGGCGGICGSAAAVGLRFGSDRESFQGSNPPTKASLTPQILQAVKQVRDRFAETYGGYLCRDIQARLFGRTFDATNPEDMAAFRRLDGSSVCRHVTANAAGWAVEAILAAEASPDQHP